MVKLPDFYQKYIMSNSTQLYSQVLGYLRQYSTYRDLRHLKTLAWMINGLIGSGQLSLSAWEPYVHSNAEQAQSLERRWRRFLENTRVCVEKLYLPLVIAALNDWQKHRLYLAIDTTVLWNRFCMIHISVVCCGRAIPLLWRVLEHGSATVAFREYEPMLRKARWLLRRHPDVMILADRGFANHDLLSWLQASNWHYCIRIPCNTYLHGVRRYPTEASSIYPNKGEAAFYRNVRLWQDGLIRCNLVVAYPEGVSEHWAVITDEPPTLKTLHEYALRFCVEELFLDSKSGAFELEDSRLRNAKSLERLYLIAALALLYSTTQGMAVQVAGLRQHVDPHWNRGLSYLKIGLRWLKGVLNKGRQLLTPISLLPQDPQPCFASNKTRQNNCDRIWFSRIYSLECRA
jgi:Transposase DDE domain